MRLQFIALQVSVALAGVAILYACSSDSPTPSNPQVDSGALAPCTPGSGEIPDPATCGPAACGGTGACAIDESKCGSPSTCLPMANNTGKQVLDFRIRRLNVLAPAALATNFVQSAVVTHNIDLKNICGDTGNGAFNWLIRVDKTNNTILTGGAPVNTDPYGSYCFYSHEVGDSGLFVGPTKGTVTFTGNTFTSETVGKLNIPIFINGQADNVVILPISYGTIKDVTISADGNCIGGFNAGALDNACNEVDNSTCTKWQAGGALGGYITLEEADGVDVADLTESLCVLVTQTTKGPDNKCVRDANGKITFKGDFCSTTKQPGGCQDSVWMAATFEASAALIDNGAGREPCSGDAGTGPVDDSGPSDAGTVDAAAVDAAADATHD